MSAFYTSLVLTIIIECFFALFMLDEFRKKKVLLTVIAANLLTNPPLVFLTTFGINKLYALLYPSVLGVSRYPNLYSTLAVYILLEVLVIVVEAWIYSNYLGVKTKRAILISGVLNMLSVVFGLMFLIFGGIFIDLLPGSPGQETFPAEPEYITPF